MYHYDPKLMESINSSALKIVELDRELTKLQSELDESRNQVANLINAEAACKRDYASEVKRLDSLIEALGWALSTIDTSDWEDDIHMSEACGKYAWAYAMLREAIASKDTTSLK